MLEAITELEMDWVNPWIGVD